MRLGEMLVRDGRLSEEDLFTAIERQAVEGGRIGSLLVQMGLIDAETLSVYLGLELGIPIATGATLERCKRSAVKLLKPEQAAHFRCIPVVIQGQTLILAVDDPHDLQALDQLSTITGYRIIPRVAPEIRIYYYLERFYGVPRPRRFQSLGETVRGSRQATAEQRHLPALPLPGLPPRVQPQAAPVPAPPLRQSAATPAAPPPVPAAAERPRTIDPDEHEALEVDAADLVEELDSDEAAVAEVTEVREGIEPVAGDTAARPSQQIPTVFEPLDLRETLDRIATTDKRGDIAEAVLGFASSVFETCVLLLVRDNMAFGWKGFGPELPPDRIETLLVPLDAPSMFQVAINSEHLYRGRAFPTTLHNHWFKILRSTVPNYSIITVISIGGRVVNLLYGHCQGGVDLSDAQVEALRRVGKAASDGYVRLISASKQVSS